jgi:predicted double-glycine peptidase
VFLGASKFQWSCFKIIFFVLTSLCLNFITTGCAADSYRPIKSILEIRHKHVVLQHYELSCAAASLATVLRYQHGYPVTEHSVALGLIDRSEYLAQPGLVRIRQGFSFLDMQRYVDSLGCTGIGLGQLSFSDLLDHAPIIVPVNFLGYPHFVVFRGATEKSVLLADPAFGNLTMSTGQFVDGWIEYRDIGRVGFIVTKDGVLSPPGVLQAGPSDFVFLNQSMHTFEGRHPK